MLCFSILNGKWKSLKRSKHTCMQTKWFYKDTTIS